MDSKVTIKEKISYISIQIIKILVCIFLIWLLVKYLFNPSIEMITKIKFNLAFIDIFLSIVSLVLYFIAEYMLVKRTCRYIIKIILSFRPYYHVKDDNGDDIILGQKQYNKYIKRSKKYYEEEKK